MERQVDFMKKIQRFFNTASKTTESLAYELPLAQYVMQ